MQVIGRLEEDHGRRSKFKHEMYNKRSITRQKLSFTSENPSFPSMEENTSEQIDHFLI